MDPDEEQLLRLQVEELKNAIHALSEKQNSQYTDLMLKLDELHTDKERLDLVVADAVQYMENLYEDAKMLVIKEGKASTSYLQSNLNIGYGRAVILMERLEEDFIIGEADGSNPREVIVKDASELVRGPFSSEADND